MPISMLKYKLWTEGYFAQGFTYLL